MRAQSTERHQSAKSSVAEREFQHAHNLLLREDGLRARRGGREGRRRARGMGVVCANWRLCELCCCRHLPLTNSWEGFSILTTVLSWYLSLFSKLPAMFIIKSPNTLLVREWIEEDYFVRKKLKILCRENVDKCLIIIRHNLVSKPSFSFC